MNNAANPESTFRADTSGIPTHICRVCGDDDSGHFYKSLRTVCKECHKARMRAYYKTPKGREVFRKSQERRMNDPVEKQRHLARCAVTNAVKAGILTRPNQCEDCGILGPVHGHHEDYSKALEVVWVCAECHARRHDGYIRESA